MRSFPSGRFVSTALRVLVGALFVGACGEIATVGATGGSTPVPGTVGDATPVDGSATGNTDGGLILADSGTVDPARCSNLGERAGTQVTVVEAGFAPVAFSVAENCAGIHLISAATLFACPYSGCAVPGGVSGKSIDAFGATGYGVVSAGNRVYVARSGDPATRTGGVFATSFDLQEPWQLISERPTQTATLRRFHGQALGEITFPQNGYVTALLYPTIANGIEQELAGDYGDESHLSQYFSTFGDGSSRALYRGRDVAPVLFELASTPSVTVTGRGISRIARGNWVLATDTRAVAIENVGEAVGVLSCPLTDLRCRDAMSATAPLARGVFGPFYAAHGRIYALRAAAGRVQVIYWDDAALAASDLTGTLLGDALPFGNVYDFDADADHLYVRGGTSTATAQVIRIAK